MEDWEFKAERDGTMTKLDFVDDHDPPPSSFRNLPR